MMKRSDIQHYLIKLQRRVSLVNLSIGVSVFGALLFFFIASRMPSPEVAALALGEVKVHQQVPNNGHAQPLETQALATSTKLELSDFVAQTPFIQSIIQRLQQEYHHKINQVAVQVSLADLKQMLVSRYPQYGDALFTFVIKQAFPEKADVVLAAVKKMETYDQWMLANLRQLNEMNFLTRKETIWNKRIALFGEQAARQIWSDEVTAQQERQQNVQKAITLLNDDHTNTLDERLYLLKTTVEENYDNTIDGLGVTPSMIAKVFLGFDSVQKDLANMSPKERQHKINQIRRQLGFTPDQIREMEKVDKIKNQRWQNGYAYMAARQALLKNNPNANQADLAALREKFFKREAPTIAKEEENGFFRYQRTRLYGRN